MTKSTLNAALFYAKLGWHILPVWSVDHDSKGNARCRCGNSECRSIGKHPVTSIKGMPMVPLGVANASTDTNIIVEWWKRYPSANIGAAGTKWFALDLDRADARYDLADLGLIPDTVESISGSGGTHILFNQPDDYKTGNATGALPHGIDVRGCNEDGTAAGYILLPPSMHASGKRYEWEVSSHPRDISVADAPPWLLDILIAANKKSREVVVIEVSDAPDLAVYDISKATKDRIVNGHGPEEDRSQKDMAVCCALVEASATPGEVAAIFHTHKIGTEGKYADHPKPESYLERTITSAFNYTRAKTPKKHIPSKVQPGAMVSKEEAHHETVALNLAYMQGWTDALAHNPAMFEILWPEFIGFDADTVNKWGIGAQMDYKADDSENEFAALVVPYYSDGEVATLDRTIHSPPKPHPQRLWESNTDVQVFDTVRQRTAPITGTVLLTGDWDEAIYTVDAGLAGYEVLAQPASSLQAGSSKLGPRIQSLTELLKDAESVVLAWPRERKAEASYLAGKLGSRVRWASMPASLRDMYRLYGMDMEQFGRILAMSCSVRR
jgi:hypothetical protein